MGQAQPLKKLFLRMFWVAFFSHFVICFFWSQLINYFENLIAWNDADQKFH